MSEIALQPNAEQALKAAAILAALPQTQCQRGFAPLGPGSSIQTKSTNHQHQMTSFIHFFTRIAQLRHQHARRRFVERLARKFTSRSKAVRFARRIP